VAEKHGQKGGGAATIVDCVRHILGMSKIA
jgi:hypothetical protein